MPDKCWKASEREIACRVGGRRIGPTGRDGPDVLSDWLQVEVKTRRKLPTWILGALQQAAQGCPGDRLPIVVLHQVGQGHDRDLVLLGLAHFQEWFCGDGKGQDRDSVG